MSGYDKASREVERMLQYRYGDKGRERSNRAAALADVAKGTRRRCLTIPPHSKYAYSGPEFGDPIRAKVCISCGAVACEPEIKEMGWEFETCPDYVIMEIFDKDLARQSGSNAKFFGGFNGTGD